MQDRLRGVLQSAARAAEGLAIRAGAPRRALLTRRIVAPDRLLIAPQDIRTGDATVADEIYVGYFSFCGKTVNAGGYSPFALEPPSAKWRRALTGFSWLRHLSAAGGGVAGDNARALVQAFMEQRQEADEPAFEPSVTARRMLSFLAHSPMLLEGAPPAFYDAFMAALAQDAKALSRALEGSARGTERLFCALALLEFCLCAEAGADVQLEAKKAFTRELERQILRDGGHIGRNPKTILDFSLDLAPLRQLYAARGMKPPQALLVAISRMIPMLRLLQHGDGSLALFNGMSATDPGELATVFTYEARGAAPPLDAPDSGYRRMTAPGALAIIDVGAPPPQEFSHAAHAGALAFEFSLGSDRVVVNCGAPAAQHEAVREIARASAAHSTLVIDDQSSSQIEPLSSKANPGLIVAGPREMRVERRRSRRGEVIEAAHDGYRDRFGLMHERILALTQDGSRFIGQDRLVAAESAKDNGAKGQGAAHGFSAHEFSARFHLHPSVGAAPQVDGRGVELALPSGARLLFEAGGYTPRLEESIFFAAPEGARKTTQIVVTGPAKPGMRLRWTFTRVEDFDDPARVPAPGDS